MKKVIFVLMLLTSLFILSSCNQWTVGTPNWEVPIQDNNVENSESEMNTYTIEITENGFSPSPLVIKAWDKVEFVNKDTNTHWPASAAHPTHTIYPWSGIEKCWTDEQSTIFDACKGLEKDEVFSFIFNEKWTWNYHDHLNSNMFWVITVE